MAPNCVAISNCRKGGCVSDIDCSNTLYKMALEYIEQGDAKSLKKLINEHNLNPNTNECEFLRQAIVHNHADIFWYLLPFYNKDVDNSDVLCEAGSLNRSDFVAALLPHCDPQVNQSEPLIWAARHNNTVLMELLIPVSNVFDAMELVNKYAPKAQEFQTQCYKGLQYLKNWVVDELSVGQNGAAKKI